MKVRKGMVGTGPRVAKGSAGLVVDTGCNSLRCSNVEISAGRIAEFDGGRTVVAVSREQIRHIKLSYDTSVKTPFLHFFMGFTLTTLGMIGMITVFTAAARPGWLMQREPGHMVLPLIPIMLWAVIGIGLLLLMRVFRAQYHLVVDTGNGECKVFFERSADVLDIGRFIRRAKIDFGYEIESSILERMQVPAR